MIVESVQKMSFCGKMTVSLDLPTLMLEIKENYFYTFIYFIYISLLNNTDICKCIIILFNIQFKNVGESRFR